MEQPHEIIGRIASTQHGLVTRDQLRDAGISDRRIGRLSGTTLERLRHGVYVVRGAPRTWVQALLAVLLVAGDDAAASHSSAARIVCFARMPDVRFELTVPRGQTCEIRGVRVHQSKLLTDADVMRVNGIRCTTFERTLCDCSALLSLSALGRTLDDGLRRGVASIKRLRDCAERLESGPGRHMSAIRALLAVRDDAFNAGGSGSELDVLGVIRAAELPEPVQQHVVRVAGRRYLLDFAWPDRKVYCEYFSLKFHSGPTAVAHDSERLTLLAGAGWHPVIVTDQTPERDIVELVRHALAVHDVGFMHRIGA